MGVVHGWVCMSSFAKTGALTGEPIITFIKDLRLSISLEGLRAGRMIKKDIDTCDFCYILQPSKQMHVEVISPIS